MKTKNIFAVALAIVSFSACEDYTEHNFDSPEALYQNTQVSQLYAKMDAAKYEAVAAHAANIERADTTDSTGLTSQQLKMLVRKQRFYGNIKPELYLPAVMREIIGNAQYYTVTEGTTVTVTLEQEVETGTTDNAYVLTTGKLEKSGSFLLVPKGEEQTIGNLSTPGFLYLTGSTLCPGKVNRLCNDAIDMDAAAQAALYAIDKDGDTWLLSNADYNYLYLDATTTNFNYIDDLGDIEDGQYPSWAITYNDSTFTYDIVNTQTKRVIRYDADNDYIVAVPDSVADNFTPIELYQLGHSNNIETVEITFRLEGGQWMAKNGYLTQIFRGTGNSTDADYIFNTYGWSIENEGSIGDLTYVWKIDNLYGLRASAFKSSTRYPSKSWAISPTINLTKAVNPVLIFSQAQRYAGNVPSQYLQVWASTNYSGRGELSQAKWKNMNKHMRGGWPDGSNWNFLRDTVDLSEFVGTEDLRIAFKYISDEVNAATWEVDSVMVKELK